MKSDDAKRVRIMRDVLLNYDPQSELEPRYGEQAFDAQLNPYFYQPREDNPYRVPWPGSIEDMRSRAPSDEELDRLPPRRLLAARFLARD